MPQVQSLDDLIAKKAIEYADQIKAAAAMADKEEEIRIESEKQLAFIQKEVGIKLEGKHEFTVASGRVDSVYSRVIIEYKNPKSPGNRIGPKADSPGSKKVVEQIKKRFYDMRHEHGQPLNSLFGVGLDGNYFIFVRFRDEKWQVQEPVEVNRHSAERFLWALFNLGTKGKPFLPEYLAGDFGSEGGNTVAISGIHALYDAIVTTDNPKAQIFFSQWKILFGEVCGYDVDSQSEKLRKLAEFYQVGVKDPKPAELLFAVHTYYALFIKLLAAEIVAFFHKLPTPLQKMMQATTSNKLEREMEDLEAGSIFRHLNITNFLEGDLFAWYTSVWTEPIEKLVREMVTRLDDYNPGTLSEDPTGSRDLLKKLYQQLFPKSVRHDLGEYYTPDWLAEHVLNEIGYVGDPDKRLLDPACGSGTFLVMAINHIRQWYDENRERCRFDESELGRKILANVIGFDLNPLAVMAARTNYLIAIRDLIGHVDKVEIPVYLCDSIMTPSEYGGLFAGKLGVAKELKTAPATFIIPTEIATNHEDMAKYAEQLEFCVRNGYSAEEFLQRCRDEELSISEHMLHIGLYDELVKLDKANKNGIWARIIKNAFAPLFIGQVDYVAGNPPWVNWEYLPPEYRQSIIPLYENTYGLFPHKGLRRRHGSARIDISSLFTYVSADRYLRESGRLGFLITESVFSTDSGKGFRQMTLPHGMPMKAYRVDNMVSLKPFEGVGNRTAAVFIEKGKKTRFPVPYYVWSQRSGAESVKMDSQLSEVLKNTLRQTHQAKPVRATDTSSQWSAGGDLINGVLQRLSGSNSYTAHAGVCTWLNSAYWVKIVRSVSADALLVRNITERAKLPVKETTSQIESQFVHPLLRPRDMRRWFAQPSAYIIVPQNPENQAHGISEAVLKRTAPKTYEFLNTFRKQLASRPGYKKYLEPQGEPFYALYDIKRYTFAKHRVVWPRIASRIDAVVLSGGQKQVIPQETIIMTHTASAEEAHYLCACLNSSPSQFFLASYSQRGGKSFASTQILEYLHVPLFDSKNAVHRKLSDLSQRCHAAAVAEDDAKLMKVESEVDEAAAELWSVSEHVLKALQETLHKQGS